VKLVLLDCALDRSISSRFHSTSERAKHIASWLGVCGHPRAGRDSRAELDFVILQGVYAEHGKRELLSVFSQTLGLLHVITDIGPWSFNLPNSAGILIASRYPVLWQRYVTFPSHAGCVHPAIRLPKGATGGVLFALFDISTLSPGRRILIMCTSAPKQDVVWSHLYESVAAILPELMAFDPHLTKTGAMLVGKFEGVPSMDEWLSARLEDPENIRTFCPRDIMLQSEPHSVPDTSQESLRRVANRSKVGAPAAIGTFSSSRFPYTWDPSHNALAAASISQESTMFTMPCRVSCVMAVDWLIADAKSTTSTNEVTKDKWSWFKSSTKGRPASSRFNPQDALNVAKALDTERQEQGNLRELKFKLFPMQCVHYSVEQVGIVASTQPTDHSAVVATLKLV